MFAVLYYASPNVKQPGFKWVTWGSVFALVIWILASVAFAFYVANFGSYDKTYGSLGGVVTFLVWLWMTNIAATATSTSRWPTKTRTTSRSCSTVPRRRASARR